MDAPSDIATTTGSTGGSPTPSHRRPPGLAAIAHRRSSFHPELATWSPWFTRVLLVVIALTGVAAAFAAGAVARMGILLAGISSEVWLSGDANRLAVASGRLSATVLALLLTGGLVVVIWTITARAFAEQLGAFGFRRGRVWSAVAWFTPVVNLYVPLGTVEDLWGAGAHATPTLELPHHFTTSTSPRSLRVWWRTLLVALTVGLIGPNYVTIDQGVTAARASVVFLVVYWLLLAAAALAAVHVFWLVDARLRRRHAALVGDEDRTRWPLDANERTKRIGAIAGAAVVVVTAVAGFVIDVPTLLGSRSALMGDSVRSGHVVAGELLGPGRFPREIRDGTCYATPSAASDVEGEIVAPAACEQPHDFEAFGQFNLAVRESREDFQQRQRDAFERCLVRFERYVGAPYATSSYDIEALVPTDESWQVDERRVLCLLRSSDGSPLVGSLRGSGR